jgi:hypothetical protein
MGFEDEVEQSFRRPCRWLIGRSKRTATPFSFAEIKPFRISNYWGEPGGYFDILKRSVGRLSEHGHAG